METNSSSMSTGPDHPEPPRAPLIAGLAPAPPMTTLRSMREATYPAYLEAAVTAFAQDNVAAGRWREVGALERSREDFQSLLGLNTPNHFLSEVLNDGADPPIGFVWYAIEPVHGSCTAYLYDLELKPEHRRKGHAFRALNLLATGATAAGATSIGLNVFANNAGAQALYRKLGYVATNISMRKVLGVLRA